MKRTLVLAVLLLSASAILPAAERGQRGPNSLTPQEIADGWILLFDGQTPFGWKTEGDVRVVDGTLRIGGEKAASAETTTEFGDFELRYAYKADGGKGAQIVLNGRPYPAASEAPPQREWVRMAWKVTSEGSSHRVEARAGGRGGQAETARQEGPSRTTVAFRVPPGGELVLRNVTLRPLGAKAIFNGKDLTGWKPIPDKKSVFTVTPKGELNIRNGGGEIQTEAQWDDFVLQLDIISMGKHLNSGVFFRALPGEFWQGYEAQIRNQWEGDDRTKPVDYGTGGLYNRQPTRKVVPNDNEWFTMTVVAHGNHFATWVNGYQCTDFTDTRQPDRSGKTGRKDDKGCISLQGHDPTTDLSFRNIRVAELPKKK